MKNLDLTWDCIVLTFFRLVLRHRLRSCVCRSHAKNVMESISILDPPLTSSIFGYTAIDLYCLPIASVFVPFRSSTSLFLTLNPTEEDSLPQKRQHDRNKHQMICATSLFKKIPSKRRGMIETSTNLSLNRTLRDRRRRFPPNEAAGYGTSTLNLILRRRIFLPKEALTTRTSTKRSLNLTPCTEEDSFQNKHRMIGESCPLYEEEDSFPKGAAHSKQAPNDLQTYTPSNRRRFPSK
jgi:hypothetical protein